MTAEDRSPGQMLCASSGTPQEKPTPGMRALRERAAAILIVVALSAGLA